jgi:hypothetical protein
MCSCGARLRELAMERRRLYREEGLQMRWRADRKRALGTGAPMTDFC